MSMRRISLCIGRDPIRHFCVCVQLLFEFSINRRLDHLTNLVN